MATAHVRELIEPLPSKLAWRLNSKYLRSMQKIVRQNYIGRHGSAKQNFILTFKMSDEQIAPPFRSLVQHFLSLGWIFGILFQGENIDTYTP